MRQVLVSVITEITSNYCIVSDTVRMVDKVTARTIVFGDTGTGKSALIRNLFVSNSRNNHDLDSSMDSDHVTIASSTCNTFVEIEYPHTVLNWDNLPSYTNRFSVYLQVWEQSNDRYQPSKADEDGITNEDEIAFSGALFCFIVVDIRNPESANNAFNKWILIREKYCPESFLCIIGTYADCASRRKVNVSQICKAASDYDAIYLEVSNTDGSNLNVLRKLILHRISYMLVVRDKFLSRSASNDAMYNETSYEDDYDVNRRFNTKTARNFEDSHAYGVQESKAGDNRDTSATPACITSIPCLEPDVLSNSIGSILSSCIGTQHWPGYVNDTDNLVKIGAKIATLVDKLSSDPKSLPDVPLEFQLTAGNRCGYGNTNNQSLSVSSEHIEEELKLHFKIMGLKLPESRFSHHNDINKSLPGTADNSTIISHNSHNSDDGSTASKTKEAKLKIHLPTDGSVVTMTLYSSYDVDQQVDAFMVQYGIEDKIKAREKLLQLARKTVDSLLSGTATSSNTEINNNDSVSRRTDGDNAEPTELQSPSQTHVKKFNIKIKIPSSGEVVELIIKENENLVLLSKQIAVMHVLTPAQEAKILKQLSQILK